MPAPDNSLRYKDVAVAPNTQLAFALESGRFHLAEQLYNECERNEKELLARYPAHGAKA